MNRPRLIRGPRIAWSVWWGILCVLLIGLWVRSYSQYDQISNTSSTLGSNRGTAYVSHLFYVVQIEGGRPRWRYFSGAATQKPATWSWHRTEGEFEIAIPIYVLVLIFAALSISSWLFRWKFSLRTLLIAITLIAVVLGLAVVYLRYS